MVTELATDTLKEELKTNKKVLVQYSAGWCGNCRIMNCLLYTSDAADE